MAMNSSTPSSQSPPPKRENFGRHLLIAGLVTVVAYFSLFYLNEWLRSRRGAWEVVFSSRDGTPELHISQPKMNIREWIKFEGETVEHFPEPIRWRFDDVMKTNIPFGMVIFHDLTYLPGTVTMNLFGHEIELLPRTLAVNRQPVAWGSKRSILLTPSEKLPPDSVLKKKGRYQE